MPGYSKPFLLYHPKGTSKSVLRSARSAQKVKRVFRALSTVKPSKTFTKKVKKILHAQVETKQAFSSLPSTAFNSGITAVGDIQNLLPTIAQGTADNARIGDQIKGQRLSIKGAVVYSPSAGSYGTYSNARLAVRIMIIQPKQYGDYSAIYNNFATWSPYLLKKGGTTTNFSGTMSDLWAPINTDAITKYYDKIMYLNGAYERTAVGGYQLLGSTKFFKINLKLRNKTIKYDSSVSSGLSPTNYAPIMLIGYVHMDGSAPDSVSTAITAQYDSIFDYEDA